MTSPQQPGWTGPPVFYAPPPPPPVPPPPPPPQTRASPLAIVAGFVGVLLLIAVIVAVIVVVSQPPPPVAPCQPGVPCSPPASLRPVSDATIAPGSSRPITTSPPVATPAPITTPGPITAPTQGPGVPTPAPSPPPGETAAPASPPASPGPSPFVPPTSPPTSDLPPALSGAVWDSDTLGYSFEYDSTEWTLGQGTEEIAVLNGIFFDAQILVEAAPASVSVGEMIQREIGRTDRFVLGRAPDTDEYDALLGPSIGYVRGEGGVYSGTLVGQDGTPLEPAGLTVLASTDGRITVAVLVVVGTPDQQFGAHTHQHLVRRSADLILKSFDWETST